MNIDWSKRKGIKKKYYLMQKKLRETIMIVYCLISEVKTVSFKLMF